MHNTTLTQTIVINNGNNIFGIIKYATRNKIFANIVTKIV